MMEGILTVLKPSGMSSSDAVVDVRRLTGVKRVGHLGTLDPQAGGVLPVCVGRAVRLFDYLVDKHKEYLAEISFGCATDTQDAQGRILAVSDIAVSRSELDAALPAFVGTQEQVAPMYSALKYQGKKLYDLARAGIEVPEKRRRIEIDTLETVEELDRNRFLIRIGCSRGTYIRTLCEDIGAFLGVPSHMAFLLRTQAGPFRLEQACSIAELQQRKEEGTLESVFVSAEDAMCSFPALHLHPSRMTATKNGLPTTVRQELDGTVRLYCDGEFLGIGTVKDREVKLTVHLY